MKSENWIKDAIFGYLGKTATISFFMLVGFLAGYNQKISHMREFVIGFNNRDWSVWVGAFLGTWLFVMMIYTLGLIIGFVLEHVTRFISQKFTPYQAQEKRKNDFVRLSDDMTSIKSEVIHQPLREREWNESA